MIVYPKIKGIKWPYEDLPELVTIRLVLENSEQKKLGIKPEETLSTTLIDLSQLVAVRDYWEKGDPVFPSEKECVCEFNGVNTDVYYVNKENIIQAWVFYKRLKNDKII